MASGTYDWANEEPRRPLEAVLDARHPNDASRSSNRAEIPSQDKVVNGTVQQVGKKVLILHCNDNFPF